MNMNRTDFIEQPLIKPFVSYVSRLLLNEAPFIHSYDITYKKWKKECGAHWSCEYLVEAKQNYWWHGSYEENMAPLDTMSTAIKAAIASNDENAALYWAMRILQWGDVYKGSVKYILDKYENTELCCALKAAVDAMQSANYDLSRFDQQDLRMDSGLTKVYSLASASSIIFDSRVAAAMTLLAHRFYSLEDVALKKQVQKLNAFACGSTITSDKKRSNIAGKRVFSPNLKPGNQAHYNLVTNWILNEAMAIANDRDSGLLVAIWGGNNCAERLRSVEAALFMIGSDISGG